MKGSNIKVADLDTMSEADKEKYKRLEAKYDACFLIERIKGRNEVSVYGSQLDVMAMLTEAILKSSEMKRMFAIALSTATRVEKSGEWNITQ